MRGGASQLGSGDVRVVLSRQAGGEPGTRHDRRIGFDDLAGVAAGIYKDFSISRELAEYVERIDPIGENNRIYMEYFRLYKDLYNHVKEDYKTLTALREGKG